MCADAAHQQVEAIGDLDGIGGALASAFRIRLGAIAHDDLDTGMLLQPSGERLCLPSFEEIDGPMTFQVHQDGAVPVAATQRKVVDAQDAGRREGGLLSLPFQPQ